MSGFCACDYDDDGSCTYWRTKTVNAARKEYRCDECTGPIAVGERYEKQEGIYEGEWYAFRICSACLDGPVAFCRHNCGCVPWGDLLGHLKEVFAEYPFERPGVKFRVGRMVIGLRRRKGLGKAVAA